MLETNWQATFCAAIMMSPALIHKPFLHIFSITCVACSDPALLAGKEFLKGHLPSMALKKLLNCFPDGWIGILGMCEMKGVYDSPGSTFSQSFHCGLGCPGCLRYKTLWTDFTAYLRSEDMRWLLRYAALLSYRNHGLWNQKHLPNSSSVIHSSATWSRHISSVKQD